MTKTISATDLNAGDAVVVVLADGSQQSAIVHTVNAVSVFFAWRFNRSVRAFNCCCVPVSEIGTRVLAVFPPNAKFLAV